MQVQPLQVDGPTRAGPILPSVHDVENENDESDEGEAMDLVNMRRIESNLIQQDDGDNHVSAYMSRQAERAEVTGLSPMEEIKLAQGELAAKAAQKGENDLHGPNPLQKRRHLWKVVKSSVLSGATHSHLPQASISTIDTEVARITKELEHDVENMTAAQALNFVESVAKGENIIKSRADNQSARRIPWYLINPSGRFRVQWDILSVVLIIYNGFYIPLSLAFGQDDANQTLITLDQAQWIFSILYLADVGVNFFSAYEARGKVETRWTVIVKKYLKTWFFLDIIAALPLDQLVSVGTSADASDAIRLNNIFRYLRVFKLFRMLSFMRILHRLEYVLLIRSNVSSLLKFCLLVFLTSHWFSCIFYFISDANPSGWVNRQGLQNGTLYAKYVNAFYWSIMTMTTVGYGDVCAGNTQERAFAIFAMIIGAWIFAYGITNVVATVANFNPNDTIFQRKMDRVNAYMDRRDLPIALRSEIREFLLNARLSTDSKLKNETKILGELSALLRSKIALAINDSVLNKMPFFQGADHNFLMELALCMKMVCFPPHEEVIIEGEIGEEMFFIFRGAVEVLQGGQQICVLGEQQYFGEMAILNQNCRRTASVRTLCFCELRMLTRQKFLLALTHYPAMRQRIAKIVHSRDQMSQKNSILRLRPSIQPTSMVEKMAVSVARSSALFESTPERQLGTTLERISQMDLQSQERYDQSVNIQEIIQKLVETQDMLVVEIGRLEEKLEQKLKDNS
ncbi:Voltage-gated Ion Channel (VIC) Superfamily [Thraustotheca clavata]|uniref:Voltage-gated Ion Channel (VIC) Superfamily n=1 Tax=Thraustotheca clavata TaxID=74557 RepID=A0A1W0A3N0_9STRA|nr:Voltage-gated Ion Channel (VIC) Superfamily [Thraustotheca clavata]